MRSPFSRWRLCLALPLLFVATGCSLFKQADKFGAQPISYEALGGWEYDQHAQALKTFKTSCVVQALRGGKLSSSSGIQVPQDVWNSLCADATRVPEGNNALAKQFFERRFTPYRVTNNDKERGLFTGYYVPVLHGSLTKRGDYKYPLYRKPPDLGKKAYYTHAQINRGALNGRKLELVWVDDPVMRFFLMIQGSGIVKLPHGKSMLVGYDGQNNYKYESLGKIMGDENLLPKDGIDFFTLRQWLYDNPSRAFELMERNPSYVFFRELKTVGVIGAANVELTPQRSLAVDNRYIPYGLPLFLETDIPVPGTTASTPFHRTMIAQDTGGAIRGPVRGDIFFGSEQNAEFLAGYMKGRGVYSLLLPREVAAPPQ